MSEAPDNIVLTYLRRIDDKVDRAIERMQGLITRVGFLEQQYANVSNRIDRIEARLERIKRRLELSPAG